MQDSDLPDRAAPGSEAEFRLVSVVCDLGCGELGHVKAPGSAQLAQSIHIFFFLLPVGCPKVNNILDGEAEGRLSPSGRGCFLSVAVAQTLC